MFDMAWSHLANRPEVFYKSQQLIDMECVRNRNKTTGLPEYLNSDTLLTFKYTLAAANEKVDCIGRGMHQCGLLGAGCRFSVMHTVDLVAIGL